jgi:hypothetical protein
MWDISILGVVLCAVSAMAIGFVWYGPVFGKAWMAEWGMTEESAKEANMAMIFGGFVALNLFAAYILGHVLATYGHPVLATSAMIGFGVGLGFVATAIGGNYLFARRSMKLFLIDAGYWTLTYTAMGAVFGALR